MNTKANYFLKMSLVSGSLAGIVLGIYQISPFSNLMWPIFIGLGVTFASGAELEKTPNYLFCMISGVLWALLYLKMDGFLRLLGLNVGVVTGICTLLITFVVCVTHLILLAETWLNVVPLVFAGLTVTFSQGGQNLIGVIVGLACGILIAVAIEPVTNLLVNKKELEKIQK
ncbi:MAG: DUF1097 domain-containing protein [Eubacteriaceae bacterium]|jgi:hypothetical protein|nr:DUF1097 domain-containing protein [Eubacteriaceae bacterium]